MFQIRFNLGSKKYVQLKYSSIIKLIYWIFSQQIISEFGVSEFIKKVIIRQKKWQNNGSMARQEKVYKGP